MQHDKIKKKESGGERKGRNGHETTSGQLFPALQALRNKRKAGLLDVAENGLKTTPGDPVTVADVKNIPKEVHVPALMAYEWDDSGTKKKLSPVQIGRLCEGVTKFRDGSGVPPAGSGVPDAAGNAKIEQGVKLAHIVNETLDGYVVWPSNDTMTKLLAV